jgi:diguanylate cyclase (GGDEF)-like protein
MHLLAWADHRTLLACHCLLSVVFAAVLLGLRRIYPELRGITSMATGFILGIPATALLSLNGAVKSIPYTLTAHICACGCYLFLYRGILHFCQSQYPPPHDDRSSSYGGHGHSWSWFNRDHGFLPILWTASILSTAFLLYFSWVHDNLVGRVVAVALAITLARALSAVTLFRYSAGHVHMVLFGCSLMGFALLSLSFAVATLLHGPPADLVQHDAVQSVTMFLSFLFLCVDGIFYVAMIGNAIARKIEQQAHLDFLTGTMNRGGIEKALSMEIARTRRTHRPFSVLMIDLDRFKEINDAFGHAAGDEALRSAARAIGSIIRIYDKLGRFGGDEFLVLLPETSGIDAMLTAARICDIHGLPEPTPDRPFFTFSIGVTHCSWNEEAIDILARADSALYQAKHNGRNGAHLKLPVNPGLRSSQPDQSPDSALSS